MYSIFIQPNVTYAKNTVIILLSSITLPNYRNKEKMYHYWPDTNIFFFFFFFYQGFFLQTLTTHRTAGEGRGPSFIPLYHEHSDIYLQLCMWDDYHMVFLRTPLDGFFCNSQDEPKRKILCYVYLFITHSHKVLKRCSETNHLQYIQTQNLQQLLSKFRMEVFHFIMHKLSSSWN